MTGKIIAFTGTHGTGKTTATLQTAAHYKMHYATHSIGLCVEQAAMSPYLINKESTAKSQMWIFTAQIKTELELLSKFDVVIADRTCVDSIAYTITMGYDSLAFAMLEMARHHLHNYKRIVFKTIENNPFCFPDGIRDAEDMEFRAKVQGTLKELYESLNVQVEYV
ncbi:MAG: AAA family ATPase [Desulfamplus sp.]|nr:AAA family ATPase [Desulfamplus sp.]